MNGNVTISMNKKLIRETRVEAAKAGKSVSKYISEVLSDHLDKGTKTGTASNPQKEAMNRFLAGPALHIAVEGRLPTADERNKR